MRLIAILTFCALFVPGAAQAQQLIGSYYTTLGPQDHYNSSGVRLTDFGAILQQDRANVHRFGRADASDQRDPIFGSRENRSRIPSIWTLGASGGGLPAYVASGGISYVYIEIYGFGNTPQYIVVHQGAG
ncbi:hypothetical protein V8J82_08405 [Gymnodinialimonas sp. 2305UL16-5]|uniref:hypothetical protein n=1 Tax=Gymnodinialimonas mytili TaxID=3126503 RepID=UPI0030A228E8